jgi:hypothetical protein
MNLIAACYYPSLVSINLWERVENPKNSQMWGISYEESRISSASRSTGHSFAADFRRKSAQGIGGSQLRAANGFGVQRLPLCTAGVEPCRTALQTARVR